jgi:hypothetical protein
MGYWRKLRNAEESVVFWVITRRRVVIICRPFLLGILTREDGTDALSRNVGK